MLGAEGPGDQFKVPPVIRAAIDGSIQPGATRSRSCENRLAGVPGLKVVAPSSPYDALGLPRSALAEDNPLITVEHLFLYGQRGSAPDDYHRVQ